MLPLPTRELVPRSAPFDRPLIFDMQDGSFLMWPVLALALMDKKIAQFTQLRNALQDLGHHFTDIDNKWVWTSLPPHIADQKLERFFLDALRASTTGFRLDDEFMYLYEIIRTFHLRTRSEHLSHTDELNRTTRMILDTTTLLWTQVHSQAQNYDFNTTLVNLLRETHTSPSFSANLQTFRNTQVGKVCDAIHSYIRAQADLKTHQDCDPSGATGDKFVELVREPLREFVAESMDVFLEGMGCLDGTTVQMTGMELLNVQMKFICKLAWFFSYASPLLRCYRHGVEVPSTACASAVASTLELLNSLRVAPEGWQEYDPAELSDVLTGPENVQRGDVSTRSFGNGSDNCGICFEQSNKFVANLVVCGHVFCEECLEGQLRSGFPTRYRCAVCRAEFFQEDGGLNRRGLPRDSVE
ncbi:hypothetical protein BDV95DRAFT_611891 [Massariosphaeria phaeospora]|uniref:RING-type domain-containing protein n=1 Tax=Massariosphaeria phaeospora TaxID=100035 RepID=A0A7C8M2N9_9PLEO|nr:hypothetical protein BDV95DRAFT_611891 [Massariosphaeria phaeospora]